MKLKMFRMQCVLALLLLYVGLAHSWDIAVTVGDELRFYTNNAITSTIRFKSQILTALAFDEVHNTMLYVDKQTDNDTICGYDLSSKENKCFTEGSGRNIHGIAFDPATDTVFFTDTNERSVNSISLKPGSENKANGNLLIKMDDGVPRDIVVDSCKGYIYWLNTNLAKPTIERARLNGSERIIFENITSVPFNSTHNLEPNSLAIDQQRHAIYWYQPVTTSEYRVYVSELNRKQKTSVLRYLTTFNPMYNHPSNSLAVSNTSFFSVEFCFQEKPVAKSTKSFADCFYITKVQASSNPVAIVANFKIADQIQGQDCEALKSRLNIAAEYNRPSCVHGVKVNGQSVCECSPGYTGERCDISVCLDYCVRGNCSFNVDEGLPECSCDAGYSGGRCEVYVCHGYCLNGGDCLLNEEDEPFCQCVGSYEGARCEADKLSL